MKRPRRPSATIEKVDERVCKLAGIDHIATIGDI